MLYKIIIAVAIVASIAAFKTGNDFHLKADLAAAELRDSQEKLEQAQKLEKEETGKLQEVIRAEGELTEANVNQKLEEKKLKETEFQNSRSDLIDRETELSRLKDEWRSLDREVRSLQQKAALAAQQSAPSYPGAYPAPAPVSGGYDARAVIKAELENFLEYLIMTPASASSTWKLYQTRLRTLLPLIQEGASVDVTLPETKGNTALHYACGIGMIDLVNWLVKHGANVNKLTDKGKSPLDCVGGGYNAAAIRQLLIQHGARRGR